MANDGSGRGDRRAVTVAYPAPRKWASGLRDRVSRRELSLLWTLVELMKAKKRRGDHRRGSSGPPLWHAAYSSEGDAINVVPRAVTSAMSLPSCDFAAVERAALFAARVAVGAAVSSSDGGIWGVSDPLCHPPVEVLRLKRGVAHAPDACRCCPAEPRFVRDTAECAAGVVDHTRIEFIDENTPVRFSPETAFI
jgi:hypothetical protein